MTSSALHNLYMLEVSICQTNLRTAIIEDPKWWVMNRMDGLFVIKICAEMDVLHHKRNVYILNKLKFCRIATAVLNVILGNIYKFMSWYIWNNLLTNVFVRFGIYIRFNLQEAKIFVWRSLNRQHYFLGCHY